MHNSVLVSKFSFSDNRQNPCDFDSSYPFREFSVCVRHLMACSFLQLFQEPKRANQVEQVLAEYAKCIKVSVGRLAQRTAHCRRLRIAILLLEVWTFFQ